MPNNGNLNFFEPRLETIHDAVVAMKQFTTYGIPKFWNNSTQLRRFFKQANLLNDLLPKILCGQRLVICNILDNLI